MNNALGVIAFVMLATCPACTAADLAAEGSFERTLNVSGPVELDVRSGSGRIEVRSGGGGSVRIYGKIRARSRSFGLAGDAEERVRQVEANPPIDQSGNLIRIGRPRDSDLWRNISISYEIVAPADTRLRAQTGSGSVAVEGIRGPVETGTGSGSIRLDSVGGGVRASTGSGSIRASGVDGAFTGSTGSGSVHVEQTGAGDVDVKTGSGGLEITSMGGGVRARTGSGGVTVRLPREKGFELRAHTSSGGIKVDHPITVQGSVSRRSVSGRVGNGGPLVDVSTSSGSIRIE